MKQYYFLEIIIISMLLTHSYSQTAEHTSNSNTFTTHTGILTNYAHFNLDSLSSYSGCLAGLNLSFEYQYKKYIDIELRFDGLWNVGNMHACNNTQATINDLRTIFDIGYAFHPCSTLWTLTPFIGVEFIYFSTVLCSQDTRQHRYYIVNVPIGFSSEWHLYDTFSVGLSFQYSLEAWQQFILTIHQPLLTNCNSIDIELSRSYGVHLEVPLTKRIDYECYQCTCALVPFFDWQRLGKSDEHTIPFIPHLKEWYIGAYFNIGIRF